MRSTATNRWILISLVGVLVVVGAGATIAVVNGDDNAPGWACPRERIGHSIVDLAQRGGSPTEMEAARAWIPSLAEDGEVSAELLRAAFDASSGPSSYVVSSGELRIDGDLFAVFGISRLSDGTWAASSVEHCMRPPVD